ncbi:TolC family protein [Pectinatus frisingensis]|uniref:TolC family protein n=1 Tax=Pectinatus frisingensis TaxID=865 RepID=UPI0015F52852|nr:TolC family protein [Pectinatus frisingensis]
MIFYQKFFVIILVGIVMLFSFNDTVLAASNELSLDDCIFLALKNNQVVKIATFDRQTSLAALNQEESGKGFTVTFTHNDKRYDTYNLHQLYVNGIKEYEWDNKDDNLITVSLPIYTGNKLENQIDEAKLNLKISDLNLETVRQQLKQNAISSYFNVLQYRNNLAVNQLSVDNYEKHLKEVQLRFEQGTVAKYDVLASQVSLANAQNNLSKAKNSYKFAIATLNNVIGFPLNNEMILKDDLEYEPYSQTLEDCEQYAMDHRPEIVQHETKIAIAHDDLDIAQSGYRPSVNFVATQNWYYSSALPGSDNSNWSVGLTASFNLFDSGVTKAKVDQAKYAIGAAEEQYSKERDDVLLEVHQYYLNLREAETRIETSKVTVEQAEESLRVANTRYEAGVGTNLDVLDAVLAFTTAKTNYIQALYDYNINKSQLDRAIGMAVK